MAHIVDPIGRRRVDYHDFLHSWVWGVLRTQALERAEGVCEVCGAEGVLHAHHKTYLRVGGNERPDDLIVLCKSCHKRVHQLAKQRVALRWGQGWGWVGLPVALVWLKREVRDGK